jgi:hypothetical protein
MAMDLHEIAGGASRFRDARTKQTLPVAAIAPL